MDEANSKSSITHLATLAIVSSEFESTVEITDKNGQPVCLKVRLCGSLVDGGPYKDGDFLDKPSNSSKLHKGYRYIEPGLATVIRELASKYEGARLHPETVDVRCVAPPVDHSSLGCAAVAAWCEAFNVQVPSQEELQTLWERQQYCPERTLSFEAFVKLQRANHYWSIELSRTAHTVHYGENGTRGRTARREFNSEQEAKESFESLIARRKKEGFEENRHNKLDDLASFWQLLSQIANTTGGLQEVENTLDKELSIRSADEIIQFARHFGTQVSEAGNDAILGAVKLLGRGKSEHCSYDFRRWLVLQGKEVFEAATRDPETLATYDDGADPHEHWCSGYSPTKIFQRVANKDLSSEVSCEKKALAGAADLDTEEQLRNRFPALWKRVHAGD